MLESPLHEHHLLRFDVEIADKPIHKSARTATIIFYDENNKRVSSYNLAVITKEEIYELIDKGEALPLNNSYIKDFSLSEYRKLRNLDEHQLIKLQDLSAKKTFFDCDLETDFSYGEFEEKKQYLNPPSFQTASLIFLMQISDTEM